VAILRRRAGGRTVGRVALAVRSGGGRVVTVGTTVVRARETVAGRDGVRAGRGRTRLHVGPRTRLGAVDSLLTGMHEPRATHLDLRSACVSPAYREAAYREALALGYRWHAFGDLNLIA
jgi:S-adenosylmethionine:tRNA ribosyltransferase-isomerase